MSRSIVKKVHFLKAIMLVLVMGQVSADETTTIDFSAYKAKAIYLDFWASWCGPCRQSFPWMNEMQKKYASHGLKIIAVNTDTEREDADRFLESTPAEFDIVYDPEGDIAMGYGLVAMPTSYYLDGEGNVLANHVGFKPERVEEYEHAIRVLLGLDELGSE